MLIYKISKDLRTVKIAEFPDHASIAYDFLQRIDIFERNFEILFQCGYKVPTSQKNFTMLQSFFDKWKICEEFKGGWFKSKLLSNVHIKVFEMIRHM